jgi:hypothetical protein
MCIGAGYGIRGLVCWLLTGVDPFNLFVSVIAGLPLLIIGLVGIVVVLTSVCSLTGWSRCELDLREDILFLRWRTGFIPLHKTRPRAWITGVHVQQKERRGGSNPEASHELVITGNDGTKLAFGLGFDRKVLADLQNRLSDELGGQLEESVRDDQTAQVVGCDPDTDGPPVPPGEGQHITAPPDGSRIEHEDSQRFALFRIPSAGLLLKQQTLRIFSIVWILATLVGVAGFILLLLVITRRVDIHFAVPLLLIVTPFVNAGVICLIGLVCSLRKGRCSIELDLTPEALRVKRRTVFGAEQVTVPTVAITAIHYSYAKTRRGFLPTVLAGMAATFRRFRPEDDRNDIYGTHLRIDRSDDRALVLSMEVSEGELAWLSSGMELKLRVWQA